MSAPWANSSSMAATWLEKSYDARRSIEPTLTRGQAAVVYGLLCWISRDLLKISDRVCGMMISDNPVSIGLCKFCSDIGSDKALTKPQGLMFRLQSA